MFMRFACVAGSSILLAAVASAVPTVTVSLTSPQHNQTVAPGATVTWTIAFTDSTGDNAGLALLSCDLVQDDGNPAFTDLNPAASVPAAMSNFSRPAGMSNPGETLPATGYVGVRRGTVGERNLIQIGGGQNTLGQALPGGSGIAENANVVGGVGQSGSVTLATGSFQVPSECGDYSFNLANVVANVLVQLNNPPAFSPVTQAAVTLTGGGVISVTIGLSGDVNGDGAVNLTDLSILLSNFGSAGGPAQGDVNGDGVVNLTDLSILLSNFGSSGC